MNFQSINLTGIMLSAVLFMSSAFTLSAFAQEPSVASDDAHAYLIFPYENQTLKAGDIPVSFGLRGMGVAPAGVDVANTGHHHLLINQSIEELDLSQPLPSNANVKHFGKGQTETVLTLDPGPYTLQLILGNHLHIAHSPPVVSEVVHITVVEAE